MQTISSTTAFRDAVAALAWGQWNEFGVRGAAASSQSHWIVDLEALVLFTAWLAPQEPRLRDEALDWCLENEAYVSVSRLKNLLALQPPEVEERFGSLAGTMRNLSAQRWPSASGEIERYQRTNRSRAPDLTRPSMLALRLRAAFGVSARAEILRILTTRGEDPKTASDLVREGVGLKKGAVLKTLESLHAAELLETRRRGHTLLHSLKRRSGLLESLDVVPVRDPDWVSILCLLATVGVVWERWSDTGKLHLAEQALQALEGASLLASRAELHSPPIEKGPDRILSAFEDWTLYVAGSLAKGHFPGPGGSSEEPGEVALLMELHRVRHKHARRLGYPAIEIGSNDLLRELAEDPPRELERLRSMLPSRAQMVRGLAEDYLSAIQEAEGAT